MKNKKLALSVLSTAVVGSMASSAFAIEDGIYIGGNVDKHYSIMTLIDKLDDNNFMKDLNDNISSVVYVNNKKGVNLLEFIQGSEDDLDKALRELTPADFDADTYTLENGQSWKASEDQDLQPAPAGELKVESVSAINPTEIKVVFNNELDKSSAENAANYTVTSGALAVSTVKLQADKKSVVVKLNGAMAVGSTYKVAVSNVLDSKYNKVTDFTSATQVFTDSKAPTLLSGEVVGGALVLKFDEPVKNTMTVKIDGQTVAVASVGTANGDYTATTAALPANLLTTGTHSVVVYDAEDVLAANANKTSVQTTTYTVTSDTVAPSVTGLTPISKDKFAIKFSEPLKGGLSSANLVVKKGSYTFSAARFDSVALDPTDTTNKTYIVDLNDSDTANPVFASGETSVTLNVTVKGYKDNADLYGADFNGSVTLTGDATKPYVLSQNLNTIAGAVISVKFSEALGATVDASKVIVKKNGIVQPLAAVTPVAVNGGDNTILDITLGAAATAGTYTVELAAGAVQDLDGNKNDAITTTATLTAPEVALALAADADGTIAAGEVGTATGEYNVITINYGEEMEDSAAVLSNYKLDGAAFPAGTSIGFYGNKQVVKITLPANYFAIDTTAKLTVSRNIKAVSGKVVEASAATKAENEVMVNFTDNIAPELTSAKFVLAAPTDTTTSTIKLTFNEGLAAIGANAASLVDDLVVKVNGNKVAVNGNTAVVGGTNEIVFTVATPINISQSVTVDIVGEGATNASLAITDDSALLNDVKAVTGVSVTK